MSKAGLEDLKTWNGNKHIILGNHDGTSEPKRTGYELRDMLDVFQTMHGFVRKYNLWLSHAPIHPDELRGRYNVHGHCHLHLIDDPRYLNICMEHINYTPISLDEIRTILKERN